MKLEPQLIKDILQWCEDKLPDREFSYSPTDMKFDKYDEFQILFHVKLLCENGYIDYIDSSSARGFDCWINHLTMDGYQYLNLLKSKAWNTAKGLMHELGVIFTEGAIKAVIDVYGNQMLPK